MIRTLIAVIAAGVLFSLSVYAGETGNGPLDPLIQDINSADPTRRAAAETALLAKLDAALAKTSGIDCETQTTLPGSVIKRRVQGRPAERKFKALDIASDSSPMEFTGDGAFIWLVSKTPEAVFVQKFSEKTFGELGSFSRPDAYNVAGEIRAHHSITKISRDKLNGEAVYVLECQQKSSSALSTELLDVPAAQRDTRTRIYVAEADLIVRKIEIVDAGGKAQSTTTISNLQPGKKHPDSVFAFTPPPGATVIDMSSQGSIESAIKSALEIDSKSGKP